MSDNQEPQAVYKRSSERSKLAPICSKKPLQYSFKTTDKFKEISRCITVEI